MAAPSQDFLLAIQEAVPPGLQPVTDRRWVSEAAGGIRRILEFQALKGAQYSARWGFSADLVPRLQKDRLAWKRTAAKAAFDLTIDPVDVEGGVPRWCSFTPDVSVKHVKKVAGAVKERAWSDFRRVDTLCDLRDLFQMRAGMKSRRISLENYVQSNLAWGLLELAAGDVQAGEARLGAFCERFAVNPADPILTKATHEALQWREG